MSVRAMASNTGWKNDAIAPLTSAGRMFSGALCWPV
jgi:hypothetical protein